jgi:hypothetical protein
MLINGAALTPVPPVEMGKATRGVELTSVDEIQERRIASWMTPSRGHARCREDNNRRPDGCREAKVQPSRAQLISD